MSDPESRRTAAALRMSLGLLLRRLRQIPGDGELTLPESSALVRLDRGGSATAAELARQEQISPQSMGATLATLEGRGLVGRIPDPADGRRVIISITAAGRRGLNNRRSVEQMARALSTDFSAAEREQLLAAAPLLERLAHSI